MKLGINAAAAGIIAVAAASALPSTAAAQATAVPSAEGALTFSREERLALAPVGQAVMLRNWAAAAAALPAAQATALSPSGRYAVGRYELDIGRGTASPEQQMRGVERILASGMAQPAEVAALLRVQAQLYNDRREYERAEAVLNRLSQLHPDNPETLALLGQINRTRNNSAQALTMFQRSLAASEQAGGRPPESRYKLALALALQGNQRAQTADLARRLVTAYPSAINWRDALLSYRDVAEPNQALSLDIVRLARASGALAGERDYLGAAAALAGVNLSPTSAQFGATVLRGLTGGLAGEAKEILDEGVSRNMLSPNEAVVRSLRTGLNAPAATARNGVAARVTAARSASTGAAARTAGDTLYGLGRHAEAVEMYRLALSKGGEDADLVNTRLGAALAMAGQTAEAQAALQAVTGQRAELARLWLAWLARRPAAPVAG